MQTVPGWGIGKIVPIGMWNETGKNLVCSEISDEGVDNVYTFTVGNLKEYAKADGEYHVDDYDQKGISINAYGGAVRKSLTIYKTNTGVAEITNELPVMVEYYSVSGMRVINPSNGIYIMRSTYGNGNVQTQKVIVE